MSKKDKSICIECGKETFPGFPLCRECASILDVCICNKILKKGKKGRPVTTCPVCKPLIKKEDGKKTSQKYRDTKKKKQIEVINFWKKKVKRLKEEIVELRGIIKKLESKIKRLIKKEGKQK